MSAKGRPEWLPEGWTATSKKRGDGRADWTFIDSSTGFRLYSKIAVFRYLESEELHTPSPNKEGRIIVYSGADTSSSQRQSVDNKFNNNTGYSSSRLPDGWIKEFKLRKAGSKLKKEPYYIDPVSGYAFRSRKDAFRYIATGNVNACLMKPKKADSSNKYSIENVGSIEKQPDGQVTRKKSSSGAIKRKPTVRVGGSRDSPKWLPSGWITEIRTQQSGRCAGHKHKCFFDPVTEIRFHSKRKLMEYLESEEIHSPLTNKETSLETMSVGDIYSPSTNKETSMETKSGDIYSPSTNKETSMETKSAGDICTSSNQTGSANNKFTSNQIVMETKSAGDPLTNKETSMETKSAGDICTSSNQRGSANKKFTSNTSSSSYELPDGWIKEVRLRKSNCRVKKDPYYIDPVSGYEFRSRKDAWRYIESGDVRRCTNRPRKRRKSDVYSIEKEDPPPSSLVHMRKESEIQLSHGEGIFLESAREKTLHDTEVNTSQGKGLDMIRESNSSSSRVRRKGQFRKKLRDKKQVDSQKQGSRAQLLPRRSKPFKTITPPTRSSKRLASALKAKLVVDSGISKPPEGPKSMAIVDQDFFKKLEVEEPPVGEETKASGDRADEIQNQESAAQLCPGETKSFEAITQTMPSVPEILPVTPEQSSVQSSEKADEREAVPTVNQDEQKGTLQSSVKAAEEEMTLPQGSGPVTFESSEKTEEAEAVPAVDQDFFEKLEAQEPPTKPSFDTPDSPLIFPFGDSWADPCLEFAFKTLTGDIPMLEDTASIENYFQQQAIQSLSPVKLSVHHPIQEGSSNAQENGLHSTSKANVEYRQGK